MKCYGNRNEHSYLFLTQISPRKTKTQTQKTKHSVTRIFCSNLDRNTAGEKPSFSVFVGIFIWCARFSFVGLNRTRNFHFFFTTCVRCITTLGKACWRQIDIATGHYSSVFQRWLKQNYKRCERFVSVNWEFLQFCTSSPAYSLLVYGTPQKTTWELFGARKNRILSFLKFLFYQNWFVHMIR